MSVLKIPMEKQHKVEKSHYHILKTYLQEKKQFMFDDSYRSQAQTGSDIEAYLRYEKEVSYSIEHSSLKPSPS
jgi:hypothetical protein